MKSSGEIKKSSQLGGQAGSPSLDVSRMCSLTPPGTHGHPQRSHSHDREKTSGVDAIGGDGVSKGGTEENQSEN